MPKKLAWFILTKNLELILVSAHVYIHVCTSINIHLQIHKHIYIYVDYIYIHLFVNCCIQPPSLERIISQVQKKAFQFTPVSSSFICASRTDIYVCMYMDVRKYIWILYIYTRLELHCRSIWNAKTYPYTSFLHFSIHFSPTPMPHPRNIGPRHGPGMLLRDPWHNRSLSRQHRNIYIYIQYIDIYMEIFAYINVGIHFNKVSCKLCLLYECWNAEYQALHSICNIHTVHIKHYSRIYKICGTNQPFWKPHQRGGCN